MAEPGDRPGDWKGEMTIKELLCMLIEFRAYGEPEAARNHSTCRRQNQCDLCKRIDALIAKATAQGVIRKMEENDVAPQ